jgi:hypothetical protein
MAIPMDLMNSRNIITRAVIQGWLHGNYPSFETALVEIIKLLEQRTDSLEKDNLRLHLLQTPDIIVVKKE